MKAVFTTSEITGRVICLKLESDSFPEEKILGMLAAAVTGAGTQFLLTDPAQDDRPCGAFILGRLQENTTETEP